MIAKFSLLIQAETVPAAEATQVTDLLAEKQRELEELKKRQMELEIAKARAVLEQQERELAELRAKAMAPHTNIAALITQPQTAQQPVDPRLPGTIIQPADPRQQPVDPRRTTDISVAPHIEETTNKEEPRVKSAAAPPSNSFGALLNQAGMCAVLLYT